MPRRGPHGRAHQAEAMGHPLDWGVWWCQHMAFVSPTAEAMGHPTGEDQATGQSRWQSSGQPGEPSFEGGEGRRFALGNPSAIPWRDGWTILPKLLKLR
jgi:hypothetical protein